MSETNSRIQYIEMWVENVSRVRPELSGFSICPFAKKSNYKIIECDAKDIFIPEKQYDVIIYIIEDSFSLEEVQKWVDFYNLKHENFKFFEDCASYDTYINGVQTNNGKYNLILTQSKEKLRKFREILSKTDYYKLWDEEYLKEILGEDYNDLISG